MLGFQHASLGHLSKLIWKKIKLNKKLWQQLSSITEMSDNHDL
jgi:hypothetical protein